ncbi:Protein FAR-RED ELONGATED HYPOCOTYL 3 [Bienertia sinuspersici]
MIIDQLLLREYNVHNSGKDIGNDLSLVEICIISWNPISQCHVWASTSFQAEDYAMLKELMETMNTRIDSVILRLDGKTLGVVEVEVDAMVVELEGSSRILDLEAPVEGGVGVDADVVGDFGCTPIKECYKAKDKTRQRWNAQWTCDRSGKVDRRKVNGKRCVIDSQIEDDLGVKTSKKCECLVQIYVSVSAKNENEWVVRKVVNEHQNYNPTPSKSRFIAAHCKEEMNCHVKRKLKLGHSASKKVSQIHNMLARERNGLQEMAINERDIRNELYRDILWVDAHSYVAYEEFNDVVCFDTTYLTNQYELPFANFVGVNRHEMYCRAVEKRVDTEKQYDDYSETFIWHIDCGFPCESIFQRCYTNMKFKEIQQELPQVRFDMKSKLAKCEYSLFNHSGIIFRHMIKLYDIHGEEVPDTYILRRWRKDVSRKHTRVKVAYHDPSRLSTLLVLMRCNLNRSQFALKLLKRQTALSAWNEGNVKDPPWMAKQAHRTTDHQYYSAVEKVVKVKPKRETKATVSKGTSHHIDVNQGAILSTTPDTFNDGPAQPYTNYEQLRDEFG